MKNAKMHPGARHSSWTVIAPTNMRNRSGCVLWEVLCDCGTTAYKRGWSIWSGEYKSCGCMHSEYQSRTMRERKCNWKHGEIHSSTYIIWGSMIKRCTNPRAKNWGDYGGRGITICDRWRDFRNFLADMGERPSKDHSIDRINNDGNYEPANCRWADRTTQANNKRNNRIVEFDGLRLTVPQWARRFGVSADAIRQRLLAKWPVNERLFTPSRNLRRQAK